MAAKTLCSVPDCGKPVHQRGWCCSHYARWRRHGDPLVQKHFYSATGVCSVDGCERPHLARGLCSSHYNQTRKKRAKAECPVPGCSRQTTGGLCWSHLRRNRLYGDPLAERKPPNGACEEWLLAHVAHDGEGCLIWPFARDDNGYGKFLRKRRKVYAAREMCILAHGEPPSPEHESAHSCGKGHEGCVHPGHLRWDTPAGNAADRLIHGTDCRGEKNVNAKLTVDAVRYIRRMRGVLLQRELAEMFGVDNSTVGKVQRRNWWAWLD